MLDPTYLDPPIEVVAASPRLEMIMSRLRSAGMRPYSSDGPVDLTAAEPLLIDIKSAPPEALRRVARGQAMQQQCRPLAILTPPGAPQMVTDAVVISRDRDIVQLRARLASQMRREARLAEFRIRGKTAEAFGVKPPVIDPDFVPEVLYLGDGGANFLALQSALKAEGVSVVAALSFRTAMDYLDSRRFSAILTDLTTGAREGASLIDWASPDAALAGVPLFALTTPETDLSDEQLTALSVCSDLLEYNAEPEVLAYRIAQMIRRYVATSPSFQNKSATASAFDSATGLYRRAFVEAHLKRQMEESAARHHPLSILTIRVEAGGSGAVTRLAEAIRNHLRDMDCAALHSPGTIIISMPMTSYRGGAKLAERLINASVRDAKLENGRVSWRVVEKRAYHTPQTLLSASLTGPFMREYAA